MIDAVRTPSSSVLIPALRVLSEEIREITPRLSTDDPEAIHDLRVALRRLRSLLRPARRIFGRFHADFVRAELGRVAQMTNTIRDEEALHETLTKFATTPRLRGLVAKLMKPRAARDRGRRNAFARAVATGAIEQACRSLDALLHLPVHPRRDGDGKRFAAKVLARAEKDIDKLGVPDDADVEGLHAVRIAYKRVRYLAMGLAPLLDPETELVRKRAERVQKRLGDVHDLDVARVVILRSRSLSPLEKATLLGAVSRARAAALVRFHEVRAAEVPVVPA